MNFVIKKSLFVLLLVHAVSAFSQNADKTLEFEKKIKGSGSIKTDFITDSGNSKIAILSHFEKISIVHLLDSSLQEIGQFEVPTREKAFFKGGVFSGDSLLFYFFTDTYKETILTTCHYSLSSKSLTQKNIDISFYNENALDVFITGNNVFILTAKNGEPVLNLHSYTSNGEKKGSRQYSFKGIISSITNQPVSSFFSLDERRPALVRNNFEPEISTSTKAQRKIFVTVDSVHILSNRDTTITEVYSLSLNNSGLKFRSIFHSSAVGIIRRGVKKSKDNSFLCNGILFYSAVNSDSLVFIVTDFATGRELQSYAAGKEDSIHFRNTALLKHGGDDKEILEKLLFKGGNTSDLVNTMLKGNLFIYGVEKQTGYEVVIGSYRRFLGNKSGYNVGMGPNPALVYPAEDKQEIFEFNTVIDKINMSHIPSVEIKSLNEKKAEIAKKKKVDMFELKYLKIGGHELFLYYNNFRKHLKLYKWEAVK